jgi:hypothetical protein
MAKAVAVRRDGDSFQARIFWRQALNLLDPRSPVVKVGFEVGPKGFDDVWVSYSPERAPQDYLGKPILREHTQCKWHVTVNDFGHADLVEPDWINASTVSLLQRARGAQEVHAPTGEGVLFRLLTNWRVAQTDPLRPLISQKSKTLRLDKLFDGTTDKSASGRIRKLWRDHLGIGDDELQLLARTLAFHTDMTSLEEHRQHLDPLLELRGLRRVPQSESSFVYDDIAFQWLAQGRLEFNRTEFRDACRREGLFDKDSSSPEVFGVKSFEHAFDRLENRCTVVLDLIPHFDERAIRDQQDWTRDIYPRLKDFLISAGKNNESLRLVLDAHVTLAYAAGSVLNIKSGRDVELEQRTAGTKVWRVGDMPSDAWWPHWDFTEEVVNATNPSAVELAVVVSLTHDALKAVKTHVEVNLPSVGKLLVARPSGGPGARSVVCGQHAFELADTLVRQIVASRPGVSLVHLFIAAPNAFTFFLGQRQPGLGKTTLYEFDFEGAQGGGYRPSLTLPV